MAGFHHTTAVLEDPHFYKGKIAEQFVAQHLMSDENRSLFYWLREGRSSNAEVDFLLQAGHEIVPVEVKSGKRGSMKSLLQFIALRGSKQAVKLSLDPPSTEQARHDVVTPHGLTSVSFTCHNLPLYFASELRRLLAKL